MKGDAAMSLHKYFIDFSSLSPDEKETLTVKLEERTWDGLQWIPPAFNSAYFMIDENSDINRLEIPEHCPFHRA